MKQALIYSTFTYILGSLSCSVAQVGTGLFPGHPTDHRVLLFYAKRLFRFRIFSL